MSESIAADCDCLERVLVHTETLAAGYLADHAYDPAETTIKIGGERHVLVRGSALSVDFFELAKQVLGEGREAEAAQFAKNTLYAWGHAMGKADARTLHAQTEISDLSARLAVGMVLSSRAGFGCAALLSDSCIVPNERCCLIYDCAFSFEAEAWLNRRGSTHMPVCFVNAGYVSGWCEGTLGMPLSAAEILCRAKGDRCCRFVVAPPDRLADCVMHYGGVRPDCRPHDKAQAILAFSGQQPAGAPSRESDEVLRSIAEAALDAIVMLDDEGNICFWNRAAEKIFGYRQEEVLGQNGHALLAPPQSAHRHREVFAHFRQTGQASILGKTLELAAIRKDGTQIPIELSLSAARVRGKWCAVGIVRDISQRKQAEETIRRNADRRHVLNKLLALSLEDLPLEEGLAQALDVILAIPWLAFESRGVIFLVQDRPETLVMTAQRGLSDEIARSCAQVPFGVCHCGRAALTQEVQYTACVDDQHPIAPPGIGPHGHYSVPILSGGEVLGVLNLYLKEGHVRDPAEIDFLRAVADSLAAMIERRRAEQALRKKEEELRQAQKLQAVGQLAGGIAHEFNNLLQAIGGYTKFAMEGLAGDDPRLDDLKQAMIATERASALTKQLLGFSRQRVLERRKVDPNEVVRDLVKMVRPLIGEHVELYLSLEEQVPKIDADPGEIQRALLNLCLNARDAMPTGGQLGIKTAQVVLHETGAESHPGVEPGRYVVFSVSDTGCGMSDEVKRRLFEPFFTTKEVGKGTGLGLAMVHGIVQQHGGAIQVSSELGKGTTFTIYLPAVEELGPRGRPSLEIRPGSATKTILVAEDEAMVRNLAVRILSQAGYEVLPAADGEEALRVFRENRDRIALVILDAIMPKRTGHEVCRAIRAEHPSTRILFCSGYDPETGNTGSLQKDGYRLVAKPFVAEELLRAVREALDEDGAAAPREPQSCDSAFSQGV